jgi:hypothetical protein
MLKIEKTETLTTGCGGTGCGIMWRERLQPTERPKFNK